MAVTGRQRWRSAEWLFALAGIVLVADAAWLQLGRLPALRQCTIERVAFSADAGAFFAGAASCAAGRDAAAAVVAVLAALVLFGAGLSGAFARLWNTLARRRLEWIVPAVVVAVTALPYLSRGDVMLRDAMQFSSLTAYLIDSLLAGESPYWSFSWYLGFSPFAYYGWLYWLVSGVLGAWWGLDPANKILLYALHIGSVGSAYAFSKAISRDARIGAVAALAYGLCFDHFARLFSGRTFLSLLYALLPLLFVAFELRLRGRLDRRRTVAILGTLSCLIVFTHQVDGAFSIAAFIVYAAVRSIEERRLPQVALDLALGFGLGALLSSFWTVPMLFEMSEISAGAKASSVFALELPTPVTLLGAVTPVLRDRPIHYLGITLLVLGAFGLFRLARARQMALPALAVVALAGALLQSDRYLPILLLAAAAGAGFGVAAFERVPASRRLFVGMALITIELAPLSAQLGYPDFSHLRGVFSTVQAKDGERVLDLSTDRRTFWPSFVYLFTKDETVFGPLIESAPPGLVLWTAVAQHGAEEYYDQQRGFGERTLDGLYLLGVKHVLLHEEQRGLSPTAVSRDKRAGLGLERRLRIQELAEHSVAIAAPQLVRVGALALEQQEGWTIKAAYEQRAIPFDEVNAILDRMQLQRAARVAAALLVVDAEPASLPAPASLEIHQVTTAPNRVTIDYESSETFLQLSYAYSTHLRLLLDGAAVPFHRTAIGTLAVRTPAGVHRLEIAGRPSRLRRLAFVPSLLGVVLTIGLATRVRRSRRPADPPGIK